MIKHQERIGRQFCRNAYIYDERDAIVYPLPDDFDVAPLFMIQPYAQPGPQQVMARDASDKSSFVDDRQTDQTIHVHDFNGLFDRGLRSDHRRRGGMISPAVRVFRSRPDLRAFNKSISVSFPTTRPEQFKTGSS
jgi:hypothetical protein